MTLDELVTAVGEELGILGAGQTFSAEDSAMVKRRYERVRALYWHRGWITWDATDDIPDEAALGIIPLTAYECSVPFGLPKDGNMKQEGERWLADYRKRGYSKKSAKFKAY